MHNLLIYEDTEIPWLKIFTQEPYKELGDVPKELRVRLWEVYDLIEFEMKRHYNPKKINMASFANMLPRVHIHVMARFENDSYFPNPMWGEKMRESDLKFTDEEKFYKHIFNALTVLQNKAIKNS
jgi:diadenosine tetraphosphate (Ap4A) HIT family hydrolase